MIDDISLEILEGLFDFMNDKDNTERVVLGDESYTELGYVVSSYWELYIVGKLFRVAFLDAWKVKQQNCYVIMGETWKIALHYNPSYTAVDRFDVMDVRRWEGESYLHVAGSYEDFENDMLAAKMFLG